MKNDGTIAVIRDSKKLHAAIDSTIKAYDKVNTQAHEALVSSLFQLANGTVEHINKLYNGMKPGIQRQFKEYLRTYAGQDVNGKREFWLKHSDKTGFTVNKGKALANRDEWKANPDKFLALTFFTTEIPDKPAPDFNDEMLLKAIDGLVKRSEGSEKRHSVVSAELKAALLNARKVVAEAKAA